VYEGVNLSGGAKAAVSEFYLDRGELPADNTMAGLSPADQISGAYTNSVAVQHGVIVVTYGNEAHAILQDQDLVMEPDTTESDRLQWSCYSSTIARKHLPAACR
ncbi:MAG: prepilin-type cleavage/methylation domain-containing protein, partial [Acidimicrobiia bacterium]|nr:prepilin-type cleavage/methylation domain-containing protein [Acidimicrobiia bacterium]